MENSRKLSEQMQIMLDEIKNHPRIVTQPTPISEHLESSIPPPPSVTANVGVERT